MTTVDDKVTELLDQDEVWVKVSLDGTVPVDARPKTLIDQDMSAYFTIFTIGSDKVEPRGEAVRYEKVRDLSFVPEDGEPMRVLRYRKEYDARG